MMVIVCEVCKEPADYVVSVWHDPGLSLVSVCESCHAKRQDDIRAAAVSKKQFESHQVRVKL